jgi:hypothetical protein
VDIALVVDDKGKVQCALKKLARNRPPGPKVSGRFPMNPSATINGSENKKGDGGPKKKGDEPKAKENDPGKKEAFWKPGGKKKDVGRKDGLKKKDEEKMAVGRRTMKGRMAEGTKRNH